MTAHDGTVWALAFAIVAVAAAFTWLLIRSAGTVGRVNKILDQTATEVPATLASARKVVENVEQVTEDVARASAVIRDGAEAARLIVDRVRETVKFFDETIFSKLSALAPLFAAVGAFIGKFVAGRARTPVTGSGPDAQPKDD